MNESDYFRMHKLYVTKFNNEINVTPDGYSVLDGRNQFTRAGIWLTEGERINNN